MKLGKYNVMHYSSPSPILRVIRWVSLFRGLDTEKLSVVELNHMTYVNLTVLFCESA